MASRSSFIPLESGLPDDHSFNNTFSPPNTPLLHPSSCQVLHDLSLHSSISLIHTMQKKRQLLIPTTHGWTFAVRLHSCHQLCIQCLCKPQRGLDKDIRFSRATTHSKPDCSGQYSLPYFGGVLLLTLYSEELSQEAEEET